MATLLQDNVITSAGLAPAPTIKTVPQPQDTTNYAGITGGVTESIISDYTTLNNRLNSGEKQQTGTAQSILDVMGELTGKTTYSQNANEAAGVNTETANLNRYAQQLADLNAQATSLNREAQAIPLQVQEQNRNTGATDRGVAPQEAGALRLNALRALSIGQQSDIAAAAATGSQLRLQAAKDKAQQIVDLKYKPLEEALAIKQKQYELNKDILTSIDKKRTEALTVSLNKEAKDLEEAKAKEKAIQDILTTAGIQQAPQDLLTRAQKAKTPSEAAMILGQYAGDYYKTELLKQQIQTEKAQRAKIAADMNGTKIPTIKSINGVDMQWDGSKWIPAVVGTDGAKTDPVVIQASLDGLNTIKNLSSDSLSIAANTGYLRAGSMNPLFRNRLADWRANMENTLAKLTVTELARVKNTGVTFGALSEGERKAVADAATALNAAKEYEGEGENRRWTGRFNASDTLVKEQLAKIENLAELDFQKRSGGIPSSEYGKEKTPNKFQQASGTQTTVIPGAAYVKDVGADGSINFELPKQP